MMYTVVVSSSCWKKCRAALDFPLPVSLRTIFELTMDLQESSLCNFCSQSRVLSEVPVHHSYDYLQAQPTCVKQSEHRAKRNISLGISCQFHVLG